MADRSKEDQEQGIPLRGSSFDGEEEGDSLVGRARASAQPRSLLPPFSLATIDNNAPVSVLAYCMASISMTVVNKYVVSGAEWNLTFFYLAAQVCLQLPPSKMAARLLTFLGHYLHHCHYPVQEGRPDQVSCPGDSRQEQEMYVYCCSNSNIIHVFNLLTAVLGFPISFLLVGMIYTSTKALQYLSVPVYTIFKNLTIIAIAYGEVFIWGGQVTRLAMMAFSLMVLSSVVAAWADIRSALTGDMGDDSNDALATLNAGYFWMAMNVICTATYTLSLRKVIKKMDFKDWDSTFTFPFWQCRD